MSLSFPPPVGSTSLDRAALAANCGSYAMWAEAPEAIKKYGSMVKSPSGYPLQSPYVSIAKSEFRIYPAESGPNLGAGTDEPSLFDLLDGSSDSTQ